MDVSGMVSPYEAARLIGWSYQKLWRVAKSDPRLAACAVWSGVKKPRSSWNLKLLREAGFIKEVANATP
jgi:hypothetical protein